MLSGSFYLASGLCYFHAVGLPTLTRERAGIVIQAFGEQTPDSTGPSFWIESRYEFDPVPEPATLALLATGLIGAGLKGWRQGRAPSRGVPVVLLSTPAQP